ncbi:MAG: hypothetical protein WAM82_36860 [Thermoanaerobaculia bacterium]
MITDMQNHLPDQGHLLDQGAEKSKQGSSGNGHNPPKPTLTVRIGVTGHRTDKLPPPGEDQQLRDAIRQVLEEIREITLEIFSHSQREKPNFETYSSEQPCLRLVSPLAEGADRLVAEEALGLSMELHCPLPFSRDEYTKDFPTKASQEAFENLLSKATRVFELDGPEDEDRRDEAYLMAGRTVLRQCDVLIAIWDQARAFGIGGTGQIVQEAIVLGLPVVWVDPQSKHKPALWESTQRENPGTRKHISLLRKRLKNILQFPSAPHERSALCRFLAEKQPSRSLGFFFKVFCKLWVWNWLRPTLKVRNYYTTARRQWEETWKILSLTELKDMAESKATRPLETGYLEPFAWADGLADFYANKYRSSFVIVYILGALAIMYAFLASRSVGREAFAFSTIELLLILAILGITFWGRSRLWHQRWMDYRALAEQLRQMQFLSLLGRVTSSLYVQARLKLGDPTNKWFDWYFRAFSRQTGMIQARLDGAYLESYQEVLDGAIQSQLKYHGMNSENYDKLSRRLRRTTHVFFFFTLVFCSLHLAAHGQEQSLPPLLAFGTIVFPAFAGALGAVLHSGEFESIALRSGDLRRRLETITLQLRAVNEVTSSRDLGLIAQNVSEISLEGLVDWRAAVIDKDLSLPA